ncbi:hypothetical protein [Arenibaculum sp.]|jgi:hypothetical protein|uniref:hypothetical protein n=1 Tax=Arenibaculum sp. TaxID=2865862 RepID=UPI002E157185|nr:hypothetical protein [Arenibaculum sp.]
MDSRIIRALTPDAARRLGKYYLSIARRLLDHAGEDEAQARQEAEQRAWWARMEAAGRRVIEMQSAGIDLDRAIASVALTEDVPRETIRAHYKRCVKMSRDARRGYHTSRTQKSPPSATPAGSCRTDTADAVT